MQGPGFCSFYWRDLISFVVYPDNHNRKNWKTSINVLRILTWHLVTHWSSFHLSNGFSSSIFHVLHSVRVVPLTLHSELLPITELWDILQDSSWLLIERRCQGGVLNERAPNRVTFKPESVIRDDEDERKVARLLSWKGRWGLWMEPESACSFYSCRVFNHWRISVRLLIKSFRKSLVFNVSESKGPTGQWVPLIQKYWKLNLYKNI